MKRAILTSVVVVVGALLGAALPVQAAVTTGPGGSGVTVGNSSLISALDLSDTFTGTADGGAPNRPYIPAIQPAPAYVLENTHGNLGRSWTGGFSFAQDPSAGGAGFVNGTPTYPGDANSGSATGFTQTGGSVDYGVPFGLRNKFVAQVDAVQVFDRVDITTSLSPGGIASSTGLSVFFRTTGHPTYPEIGIYRPGVPGPAETDSGLTSGIAPGNTWNNLAVAFDRPNNSIEVFVNEVSRGTIDLNTFAGGKYANFATDAVNFGAAVGAGANRTWTDNAQIGVAQTIGPSSLVSYWNFDEASSGTATAWDQVHANNGSFAGTATRTAGLIGAGAAQFNHVNGDGVNVGNGQNGLNNLFSFTKGVTVEALILPDAGLGTNRFEEIFRKEDGNNRILLSFQEWGGILSFGINDGTGYGELDMPLDGVAGRPTLADLKDGNLHHIVAAYDSDSGLKGIYVDGLLRYSTTVGAGVDMISGGGAPATIGALGGNEPFFGVIDEVAIYNRALSAEVIGTHWSYVLQGANYFVPEPSTLLVWSLLAGLGIAAGWRRRRAP